MQGHPDATMFGTADETFFDTPIGGSPFVSAVHLFGNGIGDIQSFTFWECDVAAGTHVVDVQSTANEVQSRSLIVLGQ